MSNAVNGLAQRRGTKQKRIKCSNLNTTGRENRRKGYDEGALLKEAKKGIV